MSPTISILCSRFKHESRMTRFEGKENDEDICSLIMLFAQLVKLLLYV
jgi:hypothetical protein